MRPVIPHWFLTNVRKTKLLSSCRLCTSQISLLTKNRKKLPEVVNFYNMSKGGVDCADQMIETYSSKFATRRWPVVLFCNLLDIAALNAYVLFEKLKVDGAGKEKRRSFIKRLGKGLCQELQEQRRSDASCNSSQSGHSTTVRWHWRSSEETRSLSCLSPTDRQKGYGCVQGMP